MQFLLKNITQLCLTSKFRDHQGQFLNLLDLSFSKLSLLLNFDPEKADIFEVEDTRGHC